MFVPPRRPQYARCEAVLGRLELAPRPGAPPFVACPRCTPTCARPTDARSDGWTPLVVRIWRAEVVGWASSADVIPLPPGTLPGRMSVAPRIRAGHVCGIDPGARITLAPGTVIRDRPAGRPVGLAREAVDVSVVARRGAWAEVSVHATDLGPVGGFVPSP